MYIPKISLHIGETFYRFREIFQFLFLAGFYGIFDAVVDVSLEYDLSCLVEGGFGSTDL